MRPLSLLILSVVLPACMFEIAAGKRPTAEPLRITARVQSETGIAREQVGQVNYTNGAGQHAGTAAVYANRTYTTTRVLWRAYQGDQPIADEDLFRFAGDDEAADQSHAYRRRGRWMLRIGIVGAIAGAGAMIVGNALEDTNLLIGGAIGFGLGPTIAYFGAAYLHPENHAVSHAHAEEAVQRYNEQHPVAPHVTLATGRW